MVHEGERDLLKFRQRVAPEHCSLLAMQHAGDESQGDVAQLALQWGAQPIAQAMPGGVSYMRKRLWAVGMARPLAPSSIYCKQSLVGLLHHCTHTSRTALAWHLAWYNLWGPSFVAPPC